jgi:hypothetical protein
MQAPDSSDEFVSPQVAVPIIQIFCNTPLWAAESAIR